MGKNINEYINKFIDSYHNDKNGRYRSYDHCRESFLKYKNDETMYNYITLNLYAYLASWGMLRNSFLMQKDYLFSKPVVEILCKDKYSNLISFNPFKENIITDLETIMSLRDEIKEYYMGQTYIEDDTNKTKTISNVTDTLITKIILGTLGCVPAYDQYFVKALRRNKINGVFNLNSMKQIIQYAKDNKEEIEKACNKLGDLYTPMKIIDMYFWEVGIEK